MENTPAPRLVSRPIPPEPDTKEHERWCRDGSISYPGGTLTTAYGNLVQTWAPSPVDGVCAGAVEVTRASYSATRTNTIGGDSKQINVPASSYTKYPRKNSGLAGGGKVFTFVTSEGDFTARVTGDVQSLVDQLCAQRDQQFISFSVFTDHGASYGPFNAPGATD